MAKAKAQATFDKATQLFLPYQIKYLRDKSRFKILEKSRRIGGTYIQSFEDVMDCIEQAGLKVWFSSADLSAGTEYLDYCEEWVRKLNAAAKQIAQVTQGSLGGIDFVDEDKDILSRVIEFRNGSKITVLSSNPKAFRSKGGKIVWDEAAHHEQDEKMWTAAQPVATLGHPIRVLSTHNGKKCTFYNLIADAMKQETDPKIKKVWSRHRVTILDAVDQGFVDMALGHKTTLEERERWLAELRATCLSEAQWRQEFMCEPVDEATAFLPYELIRSCEREGLLSLDPTLPIRDGGPLYLGMDVARRRHLSVIYVLEKCGSVLHTRYLRTMHNMPFSEQLDILAPLMKHPRMVRGCLDATGMGINFAEDAQTRFGKYRIEAVTFTGRNKEIMAHGLRREFEDVSVLIPDDGAQRESLHSVQAVVTAANNPRFEAAETPFGHGDHFWGLALAVHAARDPSVGPPWVCSRSSQGQKRNSRATTSDTNKFFGFANRNAIDRWSSLK